MACICLMEIMSPKSVGDWLGWLSQSPWSFSEPYSGLCFGKYKHFLVAGHGTGFLLMVVKRENSSGPLQREFSGVLPRGASEFLLLLSVR